MAFRLYETFLKFEVAAVESCGEVVGLEDDGIVANIIVEVDKLVIILEMERVLNKISLIALELNIGDFHIIDEADNLIKYLILGLAECAQVNRCMNSG